MVWEGCSLSHHLHICRTTWMWGLKNRNVLGQFQDPNLCWICEAGRPNPALLGLCWGRASCPSPQWGAPLQLGSSAVFPPKQAPGRSSRTPSCTGIILASICAWATENTLLLLSLECLKWGFPVWKKKHSCLKNQKKSCFIDYSLWEMKVA